MSRPAVNIVYIHSHDTGRYIQPYGHAVPTPCLQRLAEEGILFRQTFCAAPTCSPSRAALLTGQSAHSSGMLGLAHRGFALYDYNQHIVHPLRQAGYMSALAGVQHVSHPGAEKIGYDILLGSKEPESAAVSWLGTKPPQPFFLDVGFTETHRHARVENGAFNTAGRQGNPRYCRPPLPLPDTPETRSDMADFQVAAARLDAKIGIVLDALDRLGLAEQTLVIYTTDHGIAFPRMKCNLTDHGTGVALLMRGPGFFQGGKTIEALVSHIDVYPTLCEVAGVAIPTWVQGRSLLPLLRGEQDEINEAIYAEVTYHAAYEPQRAVRTRRWKYIRRFGERGRPVLPNCDDSPSKDFLLKEGWQISPVPAEALYDLVMDPQEAANLAADPAHAEVLAEMRARLADWMERTADPLLAGPVPAPAGAVVNDPDGVSPQERTRQ